MDFCEMYERYYHRVYYTALKVTKCPSSAEDILQETFIKAYDKRREVRDGEKVGAWLATIAHRKAIDFLRKERKAVHVPIEDLTVLPPVMSDAPSDVERICECRNLEENIKKRISLLSPKLRVVFQLSYDREWKEKEIAQVLGISQAAVKSRLHRARQELKMKMQVEKHHYSTA